MFNNALNEIIDRLIYDSGLTETEAISLVARMFQEELPGCIDMLQTAQDDAPAPNKGRFLPWN